LLIDTGNKDSGVIKQIQKVTMCNKVHIQNLLLTHPDQDHIGEATRLIEMGLVDKIIHNGFLDIDQKNESMTENNLEQAVKDNNITTQNIFKNHDIGFKVFNETYLFPIVEPYTDKKGQSKAVDDNDYSIVLKMSYGGQSFMLTGDAPQKAEKDMIKEYCNGSNKMSTSTTDCPTLKSTVLKLGHHGSKNSSSQEWLDRVDATDYIVSAGFKNKYGHPNKEVLQRVYNRPDSRVRKTSVEGNIVYLLD
jgi:competence protein ComEC